jgi:hypothetical protein
MVPIFEGLLFAPTMAMERGFMSSKKKDWDMLNTLRNKMIKKREGKSYQGKTVDAMINSNDRSFFNSKKLPFSQKF